MGCELRKIARRRAELVSRAEFERQDLVGNQVWTSMPFLLAERVLDFGRSSGSRSTTLLYAGSILLVVSPAAPLRWAGRGLKIWMAVNKIRKMIQR
jgi:hypothetical protein